ncbi:MAG: outer membrane protein assembly factor BamA [Syntrophorhabdaceae bacterium]|nr:outer membrane protein assembly factor BamA [Syntrophorhabdaceae bacterium]
MAKIWNTSVLIFILFILPFSVFGQEGDRIIKIGVTGNEKIDTGFILNNIKTKEQEPYDLDKLRDDLKNIYRTGFFSDVQIDVKTDEKGKIVTFIVIERPTVRGVYITGNKKIKTADLSGKIKIKAGSVLNTEKIKESLDEIKKHYANQGYYAAKVSYDIDYQEGYEANVRIYIEEPEKAYVRRITFTGNKVFKENKLKDYMKTKEKGIFSWFTGSGILDEDSLEDDRKNIEAFYSDNGYIKAKVGVPEIKLSEDQKSLTLTIPVDEGNLYRIGKIDFTGDVLFSKEEFFKNIKSRTGNIFRSSIYHGDMLSINDMYQDKGYAFCEVSPLTTIEEEDLKVNITYNISKGQEIFINRINLLGNTKTKDKVIRRELTFAEGDRFSAKNIKDSKKWLTNTTYFKDTDFKIIKTEEPDKVNIDLTVEERPTGSISLGVGYSTLEKMILSGVISQDNFLGTGRRVSLSAAFSSISQQFQFSFYEPYIFDKRMGAGFSLFNYTRIFDTYDYKKKGGGLSLSKPLTEDREIRGSVRYRLEATDVTNIDDTASTYIKEQEGTRTTSSMTFALSKMSIDNIMNPSKGENAEVALEIAGGPFSGDNYFVRATAFYGRYIPAGFWDSTFFVKGTIGTIRPYGGKKVPIYENFFVGGLYTIRGFKYGEAGPKDSTGVVVGGKHALYFNTEWIFPIYKPAGIKGVLFYDAGGAFDDSDGFMIKKGYMKATAGFGIRWFSPMGPLRIEVGFNLFPKGDERRNVFDFSIGTQY